MDREVRMIGNTWSVLYLYPLDDERFTKVTGDFDSGTEFSGNMAQVRWPSAILCTADARKFAAAIIEACDWVDEQGEKNA